METESVNLTRSPYEILQISHWADEESIKSKYFHLVRQYNPEYFPDEFIEIRTAYDILKDPNTRAATDVEMLIPPPSFHSPDYPDFPEKQLSLFKLNQELKTLGADESIEKLSGQEREQALHLLRGIGLYHADHAQLEEAKSAWAKIVQIDPDDDISQQNIYYAEWLEGFQEAQQGRLEKAETIFKSLLEKVQHGALYQNLALVLEKQGKKEEATEAWKNVLNFYNQELKKEPENKQLKAYVLAIHKYTGGKFLNSGKEADSSDYSASGSAKELGYACIQKGNWRQAVDALERALRESPNDVDVLCQLGWAYLNTNLHNKAFQMWSSALKKAPGKKSIIDHLVRGYTIFGKRLKEQRIYNQALVQFKNALKYEPQNVEIRVQLADTYFQMRNFMSALQEYQKILDFEPRNKVARQGVRECKRLGGLR
ncbi:MAG: tetratricopeptide repeat protein [Candidatus Hinthialibacter sp.]